MRIIAGKFGGRKLVSPKGLETRPSSERVREALFNILGPIEGISLLDLFAGTGAIGFEALSRGASHVTFVEQDRRALEALRSNVAQLGVEGATTLIAGDAIKVAPHLKSYDLIFVDRPYADDPIPVIELIASNNLLAPGGQLFVETGRAIEWSGEGLVQKMDRRYGRARLTLFETS